MRLTLAISLVVTVLNGAVMAQDHQTSAYAGQETRPIKSLSEDDIAVLQRGGGWGLAKAAELNGVPGPTHLLEMKDEIPLSLDQVEAITDLFRSMQANAIAAGERLIALEAELDAAFQARSVTDNSLRRLLDRIAVTRSELRYIHLSTHLRTPEILTERQIAKYNTLRGYADDPCDSVPEGHAPDMWRQHNGCS